MFCNLPGGGNDNSKFERIFSEAPAWLLKFTAIEWDAKLLGFKLRELVGAPELGRQARLDRNYWPGLPSETIDAGGPCSEPDEPWEKIVERRCQGTPLTAAVLSDPFATGDTSDCDCGECSLYGI